MADQPLSKQKKEARKKGYAAAGAASATALLSFLLSWAFLFPGIPITGWLTYRWLRHRAEWGIKF